MFDTVRETIAFGIIGAALFIAVPWSTYAVRNRRLEKLRRRGIKRYGH